jgi:small subunit ribosomal protein S21
MRRPKPICGKQNAARHAPSQFKTRQAEPSRHAAVFVAVFINFLLDLLTRRCKTPSVQLGEVGRCSLLAEVRLQDGEPLENALRRFKRKVQQEDIVKEVKRHSFYLKPGEKRRLKQALARKRNRKKARKEQD